MFEEIIGIAALYKASLLWPTQNRDFRSQNRDEDDQNCDEDDQNRDEDDQNRGEDDQNQRFRTLHEVL